MASCSQTGCGSGARREVEEVKGQVSRYGWSCMSQNLAQWQGGMLGEYVAFEKHRQVARWEQSWEYQDGWEQGGKDEKKHGMTGEKQGGEKE